MRKNGRKLLSLTLALCLVCALLPTAALAADTAIRIVPTDIRADRVMNQEGYGSLIINNTIKFDETVGDLDGDPAKLALIDREGKFVFPYREDPIGGAFVGDARFYCSDSNVSLTMNGCHYNGEIPEYYNLDGSRAFTLEPTDTGEYIDEDGVSRQEWTSWLGGPMQDGYAVVIEKLYSSWHNGWAGGGDSIGDNRTLIVDKNGTVTYELPPAYNETLQWGASGFATRMSLGWCGEGLIAFFEHTTGDYDQNDFNVYTAAKGYMDPYGQTVIDLQGRGYVNAFPFREGLAAVQDQTGKYGFIDKTGALVIPCIYDASHVAFCDGLCSVQQNGKWGYINKVGAVVVPTEYDEAYGSGDGLAAVVKDGATQTVSIVPGQPYEKLDSDLQGKPTVSDTANLSGDVVYVNGTKAELTVYKVGSANYFKLRDLGTLLDFFVDYENGTMIIDTSRPYSE